VHARERVIVSKVTVKIAQSIPFAQTVTKLHTATTLYR